MPCFSPAQLSPSLTGEADRTLPGADFADCFEAFSVGVIDAEAAAHRMFLRAPRWISWLMALRDALVSPFGLKTRPSQAARSQVHEDASSPDWFPVLERSPGRMVLGTDDRHLDFRVVCETSPAAPFASARTRISCYTFVRTHNRWGRLYLAGILPFHKLIVWTMLRRAAR